jgi:3-methyladenine DNA glycosylase AlkD
MATTAAGIVKELKPLGSDSYKKILRNHGIPEPVLGVKIEHLKKIQKQIKKDYRLALDLYDTGIYDARYLAGLVADASKMTKKDLRRWIDTANCGPLCEYTVAWVAAESPYGRDLALEWIDSPKEQVAAAGWSTLSGLVALKDDEELDLTELKRLLQRVEKEIHTERNTVRYAMNNFVISVGSYVKPLTEAATKSAKKVGPVEVNVGNTACKVPFAPDYIKKVQDRGSVGKKRKTVRC